MRLWLTVSPAKPEEGAHGSLWKHRTQFVSHVVMTARSVRLDALRNNFTQKQENGTMHLSTQQGNIAGNAGLRLVIANIALDELKAQHPEQHEAFVLRKDLGFTWEAIAKALQVSVWAARQNV